MKNKCTTGYKSGEVTFQTAYRSSLNLVHRINIDSHGMNVGCRSTGFSPHVTSSNLRSLLRERLGAMELTLNAPYMRASLNWRLGASWLRRWCWLEPNPANLLSIKHFLSCKNSPHGSRLTFALGGELIPGAHLVGCSLPQGNQYSNVMIMLRMSFYFQMKNEKKEYAISIDSLHLHIWIYMFDVCLLCAAVCQM